MDQMLKARRGLALSITSLRQRLPELPYAKEELRQAVLDLEKQKAALDKKIAQLSSSEERFQSARLLRSIPGVGPVTSAAVASCLSAREFNNPDQFVAFIGLDPSTHQSGQKDVHGSLTKRGDPELRRLLYMAAQSNLVANNSPYRDIYQAHRDRGLSTTAALCAVARRIARTCWSIHKHQTSFEPDRVRKQKDTPKSRPIPLPALDNET
jgi:transposase